MVVVHETFICKPGKASQLARLLKEVMKDSPAFMHIMTDMAAEFNSVIVLCQYESLAAYEQYFEDYMRDSEETREMKEKMKGYHDLYISGSRKFYKAW
ncbi:MAG: hypothetical protein QM802_18530 [Agriterribacter sp.]